MQIQGKHWYFCSFLILHLIIFVNAFHTCDKGKMQMATNLEVSTMNIYTYKNHWSCDLTQYHNNLLGLFTIHQTSDVKTDVDHQEKKEVRWKIYQCIIVTDMLFRLSQITFYIDTLKVSMPFCTYLELFSSKDNHLYLSILFIY